MRRLSLIMHDRYYQNAPKEPTEMFQKHYIERGSSKCKFLIVKPRTEHARNTVRHRGLKSIMAKLSSCLTSLYATNLSLEDTHSQERNLSGVWG